MKLALVIVGTDSARFRHASANAERLSLADRVASARRAQADLVVLPAGFLTATSFAGVRALARTLAGAFPRCQLLAGIDVVTERRKAATTGKRRGSDKSRKELKFWLVSADRARVTNIWRQRSAVAGEKATNTLPRVLTVGRKKVGVLACGELFNPAIAVGLAHAAPDAVVDVAHLSMTRFTKSLQRVADACACPSYLVQHVSLRSCPRKWRSVPNGMASAVLTYDWASYDAPGWTYGPLWAEARIWNVPA